MGTKEKLLEENAILSHTETKAPTYPFFLNYTNSITQKITEMLFFVFVSS